MPPLVHRNWMETRRRGENIYCKFCDKSRNRFAVYKLSSYLVCEHRYGLCNGGEMGKKGRGGKDLREPRSSYVTISVPNIKPINFKHLSRFVWTKPRVCSLFLDVFFFLPFSFYFFFPLSMEILLCVSMFVNVYEYSRISFIFPFLLLGNIECWYISWNRLFEIETIAEVATKYQSKSYSFYL